PLVYTGRMRARMGVQLLHAADMIAAEALAIALPVLLLHGAADRMVEGTYRQAYPKPEAAKQAMRAVIRALDADVIALQEMGSRPYLEELQRDLASDGLKYPYAELLEAGSVSEVAISTDKLCTIARFLSPEYYLVLALTPEGNFGKGRYALRIAAPKVQAEL
ncbi:MAG: hypothetical protein HGA45_39375, partial [Chloroflexales bacterium]|nr:hypothetical protein [Chloroflexales bacterium]